MDGLAQVTSNDDCTSGVTASCVTLTTTAAGVSYGIQIDGYAAANFGATVFGLYPTPANDLLAK